MNDQDANDRGAGERRFHARERVIYGASISTDRRNTARPCVIRNFSEAGARIDFGSPTRLPGEIALTIARKDRSYRARVIWWRGNAAGVAFCADAPAIAPIETDLQQRLRRSEKKTRELRRRLRDLFGEG